MTALLWFRRDLRVHDHPALTAALAAHDAVVPVFCLDDRLLHGRHASGPRTGFLLESLRDLDAALAERGSRLVVRRGRPEQVLPALAQETDAEAVFFSRDHTPFSRGRAARVHAALRGAGLAAHGFPGLTVADDVGALVTAGGAPYTVFSPFHRRWAREPRRPVLPPPAALPPLHHGLDPGRVPGLQELGLRQEVSDPMRGGEHAARERLRRFLAAGGPVHGYRLGGDVLAEDNTSRLSPYLHLGCITPREIESLLPDGEGPSKFRRQLAWRDFYHHTIHHFPANAFHEQQDRYRGTLEWNDDEAAFRRWTEGRTGFPLVDAGMRQLATEGWMHNRARLVVGSFLTKELGIDWRRGERWFMRLLLDGDEANNNGNWQWIASVGTDPQPFFRRMYSPARHQERFDPDGRYVRRFVPELARVPGEHLAEPWTMPPGVQEAAGCVIGRDYPAPMVDRRVARAAAMERYRRAAAAGDEQAAAGMMAGSSARG